VVGIHDELTGQAVNAFVALKNGNENNEQIRKDLILQVRKSIGPFAAPKQVYVVNDLPKTRSGKQMRRLLRKIVAGEEDSLGDTSTVGQPMLVPSCRTLTGSSSCPTRSRWETSSRSSMRPGRSRRGGRTVSAGEGKGRKQAAISA
jgi:hypothetical protein